MRSRPCGHELFIFLFNFNHPPHDAKKKRRDRRREAEEQARHPRLMSGVEASRPERSEVGVEIDVERGQKDENISGLLGLLPLHSGVDRMKG